MEGHQPHFAIVQAVPHSLSWRMSSIFVYENAILLLRSSLRMDLRRLRELGRDAEAEAELAGWLYGLESAAGRPFDRREGRRWAKATGRRLADESLERWKEELHQRADEVAVEELLHRHPENRLIPAAKIEEARLGKGLAYARLSLRLRDGSRLKQLWLPGDGRWESVAVNRSLEAAESALRRTLPRRLLVG